MKTTIMKSKPITVLSVLASFILTNFAHADSITKHPRVAELEDSLREQASLYLKSRFPDQPFLVNVSVDPVRRSTAKGKDDAEDLPYYDATESEPTDEWDDPNVNLHQLILRTKKVDVEVSLPDSITDQERTEVKDAMFRSLHLIEARDEVKVETRKWNTSHAQTYYALGALAAMLFFLVGLSIIQRFGYKRLAQSLSSLQMNSAPANQSSQSPMMSASPPVMAGASETQSTIKGGVEVTDPVRAKEMMNRLVEKIKDLPTFPTLNMMIQLDRYGKANPQALGALLHELPGPYQKKIFQVSNDSYWFEAMLEPGNFGMEQLNLFQRLMREANNVDHPVIEGMLIQVWRLGPELESFMRNLNRDTAISILSLFPKNIAIRVARKAFPGAWADLLDPNFKSVEFTPEHAIQVALRAEKVRPLMEVSRLSHYRKETEILDYLRVASPEEEREIYLASKQDATFLKTRPPFFVILEAQNVQLTDFVSRFTPQQWSLALFNVDRNERSKIQDIMHEKQKFLFQERMKMLDSQHPDPTQVGQIREVMARRFNEYFKEAPKANAAA